MYFVNIIPTLMSRHRGRMQSIRFITNIKFGVSSSHTGEKQNMDTKCQQIYAKFGCFSVVSSWIFFTSQGGGGGGSPQPIVNLTDFPRSPYHLALLETIKNWQYQKRLVLCLLHYIFCAYTLFILFPKIMDTRTYITIYAYFLLSCQTI